MASVRSLRTCGMRQASAPPMTRVSSARATDGANSRFATSDSGSKCALSSTLPTNVTEPSGYASAIARS